MAKKSKIETDKQAGTDVPTGSGAASAGRKQKRKKAEPRAKTPRAIKARKALPEATISPSDDEIRLRAYFIAERRLQLSLPGDSAHDWIEARRQLVEEANRTAS